jgi:hypothetical protein
VEMTQSMNVVIHHYHFHIVTVKVMIEYREINLVSYILIIIYFEVPDTNQASHDKEYRSLIVSVSKTLTQRGKSS